MRSLSAASALFLVSFTVSFSAKAVTVSTAELPATIQSCISAGTCAVFQSSSYQSGTASAFQIFDLSGNNSPSLLMRYDLVSPSGQSSIGEGGSTTPFSGYLWMQVARNYKATDTVHAVKLFTDKVTPVPASFNFNPAPSDLTLLMTTADLLAGSAYRTINYIDYGPYGIVDTGELSGDIPILCLAAGCQISAQLNLAQLNYQRLESGEIQMTGFDSLDMRGLVYSQSSAYFDNQPPYGSTQLFYIAAVPEPAEYLMLLAGIGLVGWRARRRG